MSGRRPRIAVLWNPLSGYMHAQLTALATEGAELLLFYRSAQADAPFDDDALKGSIDAHRWSARPDDAELDRLLDRFDADAILVSSWQIGPYRRAARRWRGRTLRVLCMDNQWWRTPRQRAGVAIARWLIHPTYDAAFVAGDRQADFAERLGFSAENIIWGLYTCDYPTYAAVAERRGAALPPSRFLFVGRLVESKAIDVMAEGYRLYRSRVPHPWPLLVAGTGPQEGLLRRVDGVEMLGFVQPGELPSVFDDAGCLLLPSRFEPWGVVVHEATAAGLPVVCTRVCGAATRLVLDGYNGVVMSTGNASAVAEGLSCISRAGDRERRAMGEASRTLAAQYSPERWATNLLRRIPVMRKAAGLAACPWEVPWAGRSEVLADSSRSALHRQDARANPT